MAERKLVVCAPLCFLFTKRGKLSSSKIVKVMCDAFHPREIVEAKTTLIEDTKRVKTDKGLPRLPSRRDKDVHQRTLNNATDIEFLVSALDRHRLLDQLPVYVTSNTDSTPVLKLEDGEINYLLARIDKLEDSILCVQQVVNKMYAIFMNEIENEAACRPDISGLKPVPADHITVGLMTGPPAGPSRSTPCNTTSMNWGDCHVEPATTDHVVSEEASGVLRGMTDFINGPPTHATHTTHVSTRDHAADRYNYGSSQSQSTFESHGEFDSDVAAGGDIDDDYTLVGSSKRRRNRSKLLQESRNRVEPTVRAGHTTNRPAAAAAAADGVGAVNQSTDKKTYAAATNTDRHNENRGKTNARKPLMVGTRRSPAASRNGAPSTNFSAAKPLLGKAVFCVDNVSVEMTENDMMSYVKRLSVRVLSCHETKPRRTFREVKNNIMPTDRKSFRLCINKADTSMLINAEKWPADIAISPWYFKPKTSDAPATVAPAAVASTAPAAEAAAAAGVASSACADHKDDVSGDVSGEHYDDAMNLSPITDDASKASDEQNGERNSTVLIVDMSANQTNPSNG